MFGRSINSLIHLRFGFSFFLAPIFFFALSISNNPVNWASIITFIAFHFFIYPASNGYNSYFDKDEGSIALIKNPPPIDRLLYDFSLVFDVIGIILCLLVHPLLAFMAFLYGIISKLYSHPKIRLKKYPIVSFITVALFQGGFMLYTFLFGINAGVKLPNLNSELILAISTATLLVGAGYPLTQVYQHEEDKKRGDRTISILFGVRGTFLLSAILFLTAGICMYNFYFLNGNKMAFVYFFGCLVPVLIYFLYWSYLVFKNSINANYKHSMRMNFISGSCLLFYFVVMSLIKLYF